MGKSLIGNIVFYWIFIIGGMFIGKVSGMISGKKDYIILMISLTLVYWGIAFIKQRKVNKE